MADGGAWAPPSPRGPVFDVGDDRLARAAWSRVAEPGDEVARVLVAHLGAGPALSWAFEAARDPAGARRELARLGAAGSLPGIADDAAAEVLAAMAPPAQDDERRCEEHRPTEREEPRRPSSATRLLRAVARWTPRLDGLDPRRELHVLERLGGALVVPGDERWPVAFDALATMAPLCAWVRGDADLATLARRSVAVVGARACTDYGRHVTGEIAAGLATRGFTVVSGGAYGIDAAAHRGALVSSGPTVAFLAGGIDRLYPAGNTELLRTVLRDGGAVVSEVPPGSVPSRVRFLQRNRLIAAFARATVVVEAAWRSGSLSTAARAAELSRPVGAVPGPVTSMASSGCHRLLRDGTAVCVTDAAEVAELAGDLTTDAVPERPADRARAYDGLDEVETRAWEALPLRRAASVGSVARSAGLSVTESLASLGRLELLGLARQVPGGWQRAGRPDRLGA